MNVEVKKVKKMKKAHVLIMLILISICLFCMGCNFSVSYDPSKGAQGSETPSESDVKDTEKVKYIYETKYIDFEFISDDQKESWKDSLVKLLNNEKSLVFDEGGDLVGYSYLYPDRPCIEIGYQLALFDINTDGTPELLVNVGGGSAGNAFYCVYDIMTGEEIGNLNGGHTDSWCIYFNRITGKYESIGQFEWRSGWMGKSRFVKKATITYTMAWNEPYLQEIDWMYAYYDIDAVDIELTDDNIYEGYDSAWDEVYTGVRFRVNGDSAYIDDYFAAQDSLTEDYVRIAETGIQLISWGNVTNEEDDVAAKAEKMAEALISSDQKFVQPIEMGK